MNNWSAAGGTPRESRGSTFPRRVCMLSSAHCSHNSTGPPLSFVNCGLFTTLLPFTVHGVDEGTVKQQEYSYVHASKGKNRSSGRLGTWGVGSSVVLYDRPGWPLFFFF
jgi:hypothetical protein